VDALHLFVIAIAVTMVLLGAGSWDVSNSKHFSLQNFAYALQWWAFSAVRSLHVGTGHARCGPARQSSRPTMHETGAGAAQPVTRASPIVAMSCRQSATTTAPAAAPSMRLQRYLGPARGGDEAERRSE